MIASLLFAFALAQDADPSRLIEDLGSNDVEVRTRAEAALVKLGGKALAALEAASGSTDADVRSRASALIREIRRLDRRAAICRALAPEFVAALPRAGDVATSESESDWRQLLADATGYSGQDDMLLCVERRYGATSRRDFIALAAAYADGLWRNDEVEGLLYGIADTSQIVLPEPLVTMRAAFEKAGKGRPGSIALAGGLRRKSAIARLASEGDERTRMLAADAVGSDRSKAVQALTQFLDHGDADVRLDALDRLGKARAVEAADAIVARFDDGMARVQYSAIMLSGDLALESALQPLLKRASADRVDAEAALLYALGQIGAPEAVPVLEAALKSNDDQVRRRSVAGLGRCGSAKSVELILPLLQDPQGFVRHYAILALGELRAVAAADKLIVVAKLPEDRSSVALALGRMGHAAAAADLLRWADDIDPATRQQSVLALLRLGNDGALSLVGEHLKSAPSVPRRLMLLELGRFIAPETMRKVCGAMLAKRRYTGGVEAVAKAWKDETGIDVTVESATPAPELIALPPMRATLDEGVRALIRYDTPWCFAAHAGGVRLTSEAQALEVVRAWLAQRK